MTQSRPPGSVEETIKTLQLPLSSVCATEKIQPWIITFNQIKNNTCEPVHVRQRLYSLIKKITKILCVFWYDGDKEKQTLGSCPKNNTKTPRIIQG